MTDGYREGLSVGKAQVMQSAFDAGYPIGFEIALRAGKILGVLEGYLAVKEDAVSKVERDEIRKMYERAKVELDVKELLKGVSDDTIAEAKEARGLESVQAVLLKWENLTLSEAKAD